MVRAGKNQRMATYTGITTHTQREGEIDERPSDRLNGQERRDKTRAKPNTKVSGRREAEREREEKTDKQLRQPDKHAGANTLEGQTTRTRARTKRKREREETTVVDADKQDTNRIIQISCMQT